MDALTYDLTTEVDTNSNGGDITNLIVPGSALLLPNHEILSDAGRRAQFRDDLRRVTDILIARHKNSAAPSNRWWFWGRTLRFGTFNAAETDFGHNIKSYELIHNANQVFPDRPWSSLASDRDRLMTRAWDGPAARWNQRLHSFGLDAVERDSDWWTHAEADQTLAALDLANGFTQQGQLARSAQNFLDVFVDTKSPARETFTRVARVAADTNPRKSAYGKNMYHVHEHALIMYLHGRAMEGRPARLYYAFPEDQALTAVAEPYWFDATGQTRTVGPELVEPPRAPTRSSRLHRPGRRPSADLPGAGRHRRPHERCHRLSELDRGGLAQQRRSRLPGRCRRPHRGGRQGDPRPHHRRRWRAASPGDHRPRGRARPAHPHRRRRVRGRILRRRSARQPRARTDAHGED